MKKPIASGPLSGPWHAGQYMLASIVLNGKATLEKLDEQLSIWASTLYFLLTHKTSAGKYLITAPGLASFASCYYIPTSTEIEMRWKFLLIKSIMIV